MVLLKKISDDKLEEIVKLGRSVESIKKEWSLDYMQSIMATAWENGRTIDEQLQINKYGRILPKVEPESKPLPPPVGYYPEQPKEMTYVSSFCHGLRRKGVNKDVEIKRESLVAWEIRHNIRVKLKRKGVSDNKLIHLGMFHSDKNKHRKNHVREILFKCKTPQELCDLVGSEFFEDFCIYHSELAWGIVLSGTPIPCFELKHFTRPQCKRLIQKKIISENSVVAAK